MWHKFEGSQLNMGTSMGRSESQSRLSDNDALDLVTDLSYNPKASVFDELGMRLKKSIFSQIAPLKQHLRLYRICSFKAQIHELFLKSEAKLSLITFTTTAQHEL